MSFIAAFHTFVLSITQVDRGLYVERRVKTPRHEQESLEHLYARMLAYCHGYSEGLQFVLDSSLPWAPTIAELNGLEQMTRWLYVGVPTQRMVTMALRERSITDLAVYFMSTDEYESFTRDLRGSPSNWLSRVSFYLIDSRVIHDLAATPTSSSRWSISIVDEVLYLTVDDRELTGTIRSVDPWRHFEELTHSTLKRSDG